MAQTQTNSQKSPAGRIGGKEARSKAAQTAEVQSTEMHRPNPSPRRPAMTRTSVITDEQRHAMIAEEAYLIAERRGFQGDCALDDWLQAEAEIDARLSGG